MKALLLSAPGSLALADIDVPEPGPGDIRIRVAACGAHRPAAGAWPGWREEVAVRRRYFPLHRSLPWDALGLARAAWRGLFPARG